MLDHWHGRLPVDHNHVDVDQSGCVNSELQFSVGGYVVFQNHSNQGEFLCGYSFSISGLPFDEMLVAGVLTSGGGQWGYHGVVKKLVFVPMGFWEGECL